MLMIQTLDVDIGCVEFAECVENYGLKIVLVGMLLDIGNHVL